MRQIDEEEEALVGLCGAGGRGSCEPRRLPPRKRPKQHHQKLSYRYHTPKYKVPQSQQPHFAPAQRRPSSGLVSPLSSDGLAVSSFTVCWPAAPVLCTPAIPSQSFPSSSMISFLHHSCKVDDMCAPPNWQLSAAAAARDARVVLAGVWDVWSRSCWSGACSGQGTQRGTA